MGKFFGFLISLILLSVSAPSSAQIPGQPANSFVSGSSWYCKDGYQKSGNECASIFARGAASSVTSGPTARAVSAYAPIPKSTSALPPPVSSPACSESGSCYGDISAITGLPKTNYVNGYVRKDGTAVRGYYRSRR